MRVLRLCGQYRLPRRWENEFHCVTGCKGNSFSSIIKRIFFFFFFWINSLKGLLGELPFITCGDSVTLEYMKTNLILLNLFSLSFVMMSQNHKLPECS